MRGVGLDELVGDFLRAVGGAVINDDEFPVEVTRVIRWSVSVLPSLSGEATPTVCNRGGGAKRDKKQKRDHTLFGEGSVQQPGNDGEILPLVVRRQNDRVLVS